jgi:hypothetical protein
MQLAEVIHLEFVLKIRFQLIDNVHIVCQYDEVVYIYDYNHNVMAGLQNIHQVICMTPCNVFVQKEYVNAFLSCPQGLLLSLKGCIRGVLGHFVQTPLAIPCRSLPLIHRSLHPFYASPSPWLPLI